MEMMLPDLTRAWWVKNIFFPWSLWKSRFHIRVNSQDEILEIIKEQRKKMTWQLCKGWFIGSMLLCLVTLGFPKWPVSDSSVTAISGSIARTRTCWKLWPGHELLLFTKQGSSSLCADFAQQRFVSTPFPLFIRPRFILMRPHSTLVCTDV